MSSTASRPPPRVPLCLLIFATAAAAGGCADLEYDLIEPPSLAQHVGSKTVTVRREPLAYRLTSFEDHLVVRIYNQSAQPVTLLGGASTIVDPDGLVHPLSARLIVPGSFLKLVLPPVRPLVVRTGPFGSHPGYLGPEYPYDSDPFWDGPPYYPDPFFDTPPSPGYDDQEGGYWRWDHGDVRLVLVYLYGNRMFLGREAPAPATSPATQPGSAGPAPFELPPGSFTHEFVFRLRRM